MADLLWLRSSGLEAKILRFADSGGAVFGICGGYQMLGKTLFDPHGVEHGGSLRGMGLLPVETTFTEQKTRTRVSGAFMPLSGVFSALSQKPFEGYEIHMGETRTEAPIAQVTDSVSGETKCDGCRSGNVCGCYVHGVFDGDAVAGALVRALAEQKGVDPAQLGRVSGEAYKQRQYDLLADTIRTHMDMQAIYRILREGV
jgi:adenosylcobyric acid synthase